MESYGQDHAWRVELWRVSRELPPIHPSWFPPDSYVVKLDGEPVGFACFYLTLRTGIAWMDWLITKPGLPKTEAKQAFEQLVREFWRRHGGPYRLLRGMARVGVAAEAADVGFVTSSKPSHEVMMQCPEEFLVATTEGAQQET